MHMVTIPYFESRLFISLRSCTVSFVPATPHRPASIAGLLVDLTARVSAVSLRLSAERDRERVLAAATDAYIGLDQGGVVREWNAAAERIFGYPAEQAVGQLLAALIVPQDQREAHASSRRSTSTSSPGTNGDGSEPARNARSRLARATSAEVPSGKTSHSLTDSDADGAEELTRSRTRGCPTTASAGGSTSQVSERASSSR